MTDLVALRTVRLQTIEKLYKIAGVLVPTAQEVVRPNRRAKFIRTSQTGESTTPGGPKQRKVAGR